jgi:hypothetical protein
LEVKDPVEYKLKNTDKVPERPLAAAGMALDQMTVLLAVVKGTAFAITVCSGPV